MPIYQYSPGIKSQVFTWILAHDSRSIDPRMGPVIPLASVPLQLVRFEGQIQRSYFLKTSYTAEDELKSKVHGAVRGTKEKAN